MSLSRSVLFASLGPLGAGALLLVACNGKTLSLGTNSTGSQLVSPSAVSGAVGACNANEAHPNVCCTAAAGQQPTCLVYPDAPFTQCAVGATTYPDPRSCCPLDGSGACEPPPPLDAAPPPGQPGGGGCAYVCPPGQYAPPNSNGNECCQTDPNGGTACSGWGGSGTGCACPACPPGQTCPPCDCPPPTPPACPACPPGWQVPQGDPAECCTTQPDGTIECFTQAGPPGGGPGGPPGQIDAGPPSAGSCFGSASTDGSLGPCGCQEQTNGHTYDVNCDYTVNSDPTKVACTCTTDNGAPTSTFITTGNNCSDPRTLFTQCGYPTN